MSLPVIKTNFTTGEIAPGLYGHVDLAKYAGGASTMRNMFVSYRGGAYSRPGTAFAGFSKQTGRTQPPRLIPFQFSNQQGLALEFGNFYMRVVLNGAFVTETPIPITGITRANPAVVSIANMVSAAAPIDATVTASYVVGDTITLAGGTHTTPATVTVTTTALVSAALNSPGSGNYAPGDVITLAGGTHTIAAQLTVATTKVVSATIANAGTGGTPGTQTVTGTTGTGTKFQASVTVDGSGVISAILSVTVAGSYTSNPTTPTAEPVTGGGLTGAQLNVVLGVNTFSVTNAGVYSVNSASLTQASSTGTGTGATFNTAVFGPEAVAITTPGLYTVDPANPVSQASTSGTGIGVKFNLTYAIGFSAGDWIFLSGIGGMTELNNSIYVAGATTSSGFSLEDVFGNSIDSTAFTAYTSGGTAARVYTLVTPWAEADLIWLKFTQSADVVSICCVNQSTGTEYPVYDLRRLADDNWTITEFTTVAAVQPPTNLSGSATNTASPATDYQYVATSVSANGEESFASNIADINNSVLISATAGSINLSWDASATAAHYNIYKALAAYNSTVPQGTIFGYAGQAYGTQFVDSNITPDFAQVPPTHQDPFARGRIFGLTITGGGGSITGALAFSITTSTGSGFAGYGVVVGGVMTAFVTTNAGTGYKPSDTIAFTVGGGTPPTATLIVGPETGTYPSVVNYFQERRVYAATINQPDTYFMSQPGLYMNFDVRNPVINSDAITGTPWSVQVNGIQFMLPMPGGLLCMNGLNTWLVGGNGSSALNPQAITPSSQQALPQESNGISSTVPPIRVNNDVLFVQSKGSIVRNITYQIFSNNFTGIDITLLSSHLFTGFQTVQWTWCQEPFKIVWAIRDDGVMLSLTYLKEEQVIAWSRHDTQGLFVSCCSVTEPPVDALYVATQRYLEFGSAYMIERMDNRLWDAAEDCWCVDAGVSLTQPEQSNTIVASTSVGDGSISGFTNLVGGKNYSSLTQATVIDDNGLGPGTAAGAALTIVGGVITAVTQSPPGLGYVNPSLNIYDPTGQGSGASATPLLSNRALFVADNAVFSSGMVGWIIRVGGGIAKITEYFNNKTVSANILSPIQSTLPGTTVMIPQLSWTLTEPVTRITGLTHLIDQTVTGLADGNIIPPQIVAADGSITLGAAASAVIVGLPFTAQLQTPYLMDYGQPTQQGQRKRITKATLRLENSRQIQIGTNQVDGAAVSPQQIAPTWNNLTAVTDLPGSTSYNALCPALWTGDSRQPVKGNYGKPGQLAIQQSNPLPLQVLACIPEVLSGDTPQASIPPNELPKQQGGGWKA